MSYPIRLSGACVGRSFVCSFVRSWETLPMMSKELFRLGWVYMCGGLHDQGYCS